MRISKTLVFSTFALLSIVSCKKEMTEGKQGSLSLKIEGVTKSAMPDNELLSSSQVKIYKADFSGLVREYVYSQMPANIYLPEDEYRIDISAGEICKESPQKSSWEQKSYKGSKTITIVSGQNTSATITAKSCNIISNLTYDKSVSDNFSQGFTCKISCGDGELDYKLENSGRDGYFLNEEFEPDMNWSFQGVLAKTGETITKSGTINSVEQGKKYVFSLKYTETDGMLDFDLAVDKTVIEVNDEFLFNPVSTGISATPAHEVWATHFPAYADVDESEYDSDKVYFEYKSDDMSTWARVQALRVSEGSFSANFSSLKPSTIYNYRLILTRIGSEDEEIINASKSITTDIAPQVPNSGFETTSNAESNKYLSFYDPSSADISLRDKWWCNGNQGSTTIGSSYQICYPDKSDFKEGAQSACLQSRYVVIKFAAGNLFSGRYGETLGTDGGIVLFGRPFTARPSAMRLWAKYSGGKVNRTSDNTPAEIKSGDADKASLRIALGNWDYRKYGGDKDSPILINTTDTSTFVDFSKDNSTIAFGELILDSEKDTKDWQWITIQLDYKDSSKIPSHIVISFAASMYGDYFTGCDSSKLWVDGIELLYE